MLELSENPNEVVQSTNHEGANEIFVFTRFKSLTGCFAGSRSPSTDSIPRGCSARFLGHNSSIRCILVAACGKASVEHINALPFFFLGIRYYPGTFRLHFAAAATRVAKHPCRDGR